MGYPGEAARDHSSGDQSGPAEHFAACACRPRVHDALTAVCRQASASGARALLGFIARPAHLDDVGTLDRDLAPAIGLRRDDVADVCRAGVLLVAAGFSHPVDCEALVRRAAARLGWGDAAIGLAICLAHGDRVSALVAAASASLRRALGEPVPLHTSDERLTNPRRPSADAVVLTLAAPRRTLALPAGTADTSQ